MIATPRPWFLASGTIGNGSSASRPIRYSGNCGPGTLVTTTLKNRWRLISREACPITVGGAKPLRLVSTSAPSACPPSLRSAIASRTTSRRATGPWHQTGSGAMIAATWLPRSPRWSSLRTLTGTKAVSVRSDDQRGDLGNQVAAIMAPLPVWCQEPVARLDVVREAMADLKEGGQALGAEVLTSLSGFAPPTVMGQASRLMSRQRFFNVVVTNVPGPQFPLYLMGREALDPFPMVPLAKNQGLGVAIMSYNGHMNFGLVGDYDVMYDIDDLARDIYDSLAELADAAGVEITTQPPPAVRDEMAPVV